MKWIIPVLLSVVLTVASTSAGVALEVIAPFTPGNILLTRNSIFSNGTDYLYEYTLGGSLVQTIPIARPDGPGLSAGDVAYDSQGRIHLVHDPSHISTLDPATQLWTHTPAPLAISTADYDLAIFGDFIYQRQMRMNINTHEITTINPSSPGTYSETSIGRDGLLYSLNTGSIRWDVQRTDPLTLQKVGPQIRLHDFNGGTLDGRGITASPNGDMFVAEWDGSIYKYDANGNFLLRLVTGANNLKGIDMRSDGLIMATSRFGDVIFTDTNFSTLSTFNVGNENSLNEDLFASFVSSPIPEGSTAMLVATAILLQGFLCRPRRSKSA